VAPDKLDKPREGKWLTILRNGLRDVVLLGFGAWIIWKQVYALNPNGYLALIGFALMVPSARSAIIKILSEPGSSSSSSPPQVEEHSLQSSGDSDER
jgi:hypothetical protein